MTSMKTSATNPICLSPYCLAPRKHGQPFCLDCWWTLHSDQRNAIMGMTPLRLPDERRAAVRSAIETLRTRRQLPAPQ